jgi:hypothetical protein
MLGARQFSLGYLLLEIFWIAIAITATREIAMSWTIFASQGTLLKVAILFPFAAFFWSIAIGGLFGRMNSGAAVGIVLFWAALFAMPGMVLRR